jgi:hypothetical protein
MHPRTQQLLVIILFVSVLLRLGASFVLDDQIKALPGTADQVSYHTLATRILDGHGFTFGKNWWPMTAADSPTAHWSFLYTGYLVFIYAIFGPVPLVARLFQVIVVGILQPYLAFLLGRKLFNEPIGLIAATLTAVYTYFIYYAANLMTETFYITAIMGIFYLVTLYKEKSSDVGKVDDQRSLWILAGFLGATLATAILLRQLFMLFVPILYIWLWWTCRRKAIPVYLLSSAIIFLAIIPFTIYNYLRFDRFVLLNTNAGYVVFWANHPIYGTRFEPILPPEMGTYTSLIPPELHGLDEAALDQELLRRGIQFVLDDPVRYMQLSISRIPAYFMFWPSSESQFISNVSRVTSFGLLWPFMLIGVIRVVTIRDSLKRRLRSVVFLLYLFIIIYSGIHILSWALIRYRLPVDAVLVLFASYAFVDLIRRIPVLQRLMENVFRTSEPVT